MNARGICTSLILLTLPLIAPGAWAATLAVQGGLRSAAGGPIADGKYVCFFRLYDDAKAPQFVWEEALDVPVAGGGFGAILGAAAKAIPDALLSAGKPLWLGLKVGVNDELPRQPLLRVPAAWHAQVAAGLACTGCLQAGHIAASAITADKIGFPYAGSATKGGPASLALQAKDAAHAASASSADKAKLAEQAVKASSADLASDLACTGCVGLAELDAGDVAKGFLATSGGTVKGTLAVEGHLALGSSAITGGRFAGVDLGKTPCDPAHLGQVVLDAKTARLYFCDAKSWRRISSCSGSCQDAALVACGQSIGDDCGDVGVCPGTGTLCGAGLTCDGGKCAGKPGQTKDTAGKDCKALLAAGVKADGVYWIDPGGKGDAFQAFCDMSTDGGGWTRCGHIDEAKAGNSSLVIQEGPGPVPHDQMPNKSWCGWFYLTAKPQAMLVHNLTKGDDHGQDHKLKIHWGSSPFTLYKYDNHKIAECRNLTTNKFWSGCQYATHSGWEDASFSFTVSGMNSGYSSNGDKRLILGPTATPNGDKFWHNFGADSNPQNAANNWSGALAVGMLYLR